MDKRLRSSLLTEHMMWCWVIDIIEIQLDLNEPCDGLCILINRAPQYLNPRTSYHEATHRAFNRIHRFQPDISGFFYWPNTMEGTEQRLIAAAICLREVEYELMAVGAAQ